MWAKKERSYNGSLRDPITQVFVSTRRDTPQWTGEEVLRIQCKVTLHHCRERKMDQVQGAVAFIAAAKEKWPEVSTARNAELNEIKKQIGEHRRLREPETGT